MPAPGHAPQQPPQRARAQWLPSAGHPLLVGPSPASGAIPCWWGHPLLVGPSPAGGWGHPLLVAGAMPCWWGVGSKAVTCCQATAVASRRTLATSTHCDTHARARNRLLTCGVWQPLLRQQLAQGQAGRVLGSQLLVLQEGACHGPAAQEGAPVAGVGGGSSWVGGCRGWSVTCDGRRVQAGWLGWRVCLGGLGCGGGGSRRG